MFRARPAEPLAGLTKMRDFFQLKKPETFCVTGDTATGTLISAQNWMTRRIYSVGLRLYDPRLAVVEKFENLLTTDRIDDRFSFSVAAK